MTLDRTPAAHATATAGAASRAVAGKTAASASAIIASALDAIVVISRDNIIREFNPAAERIFGWTRGEAVGQDLSLLIPAEFRERHRAGLEAHVRTGQTNVLDRRLELEALRADGTRFPVELSVSRMGPGAEPLFTAFIRDISVRRDLASQLLSRSARLRDIAESQRELAGLSTTPDDLYDRIARMAHRAMGADGAAFEVAEGGMLVYRAASGLAEGCIGLHLPLARSLSGEALRDGRTLVCVDSETDSRVDLEGCRAQGLRSMVVSVLQGADGPRGVVKVMSARPGAFGDDDAAALDVFVASLSEVLQRLQRQSLAERSASKHAAILEMREEMASSDLPLRQLMEEVAAHALQLTGAEGAVVELVDGEEMVYAGGSGTLVGEAGMRLPADGSLSGLAAREGKVLLCRDALADARVNAEACFRFGTRSLVAAPFREDARVTGVLMVISSRPDAFAPDDMDALRELVESLGLLLHRRASADRVVESERRYRMLFAHNPHPMWVYEVESLRFLEVNAAATTAYGYSRDEFLAMTILDVRPQEDRAQVIPFLERLRTIAGPSHNYRARHCRKDGTLIEVEISGDDIMFDDRRARLVLAHDVTARQRASAALEFAATHDALTGLERYSVLQGRVDARLARAEPVALLLVELDRFAAINQTLSHDVADDALRQVGGRLAEIASGGIEVAHLAGDEFVLVMSADDIQEVARTAESVRLAVARPLDVAGFGLNLTATVGIALAPDHGDSAIELLRRAEAAAERGKGLGRDCVSWFSAEAMQTLDDRISLGAHLRKAVDRAELDLVYQPQFRSGDPRPIGFEALLRWNSPLLGDVSPARFIPVAENLGLMSEIGNWVLRAACRQIRAWLDDGLAGFTVAVNVSSLQLQRSGLVATVSESLAEFRVPPACLELEITESALMENLDRARGKLQRFAAMGVSVALDDFGTGYSSLAYLKLLHLDKLKIDKAFVGGLPDDPRDAAMARTIVSIAHQFGLSVAAEGVETPAQAAFLASIGCDLLQGFLLARPMTAANAAKLLSAR